MGGPPERADDGSALTVGALVFSAVFGVSIAVNTKTRSPQTAGVAVPEPGRATFQRTLFVSLHSRGGVALGATPRAGGPRHCGQFCCQSEVLARVVTLEMRPAARMYGSVFMLGLVGRIVY